MKKIGPKSVVTGAPPPLDPPMLVGGKLDVTIVEKSKMNRDLCSQPNFTTAEDNEEQQ